MKNKIREKFVASILLTAFALTNSMMAAGALDNYYGYDAVPTIRSGAGDSSIGLSKTSEISNGNSIVNLSLREADVTQVLRMFADQAGMNIIFSGDIQGNVTMDLVNIPLKEAFDLVIRTNSLYYDIKANTLVISTAEEALSMADRSKTLTVIPVKYVNALVLSKFLNESIFSPKGKGAVRPGMSKGFIVATNPATNELIVTGNENDIEVVRDIVAKFDKKPSITNIKVNHTTPAEMASLICTSLLPSMFIDDADGGEGGSGSSSGGAAGIPTGFASDESSSSASGGSGSGISVGGGQLACKMSTQQKTTETTNSEETFTLNSLTLPNLSVSYFPSTGMVQIIGGSDTQIEMIKDYIAMNDKKTPQAYLEVQIISLNETGSKTFDNTWTFLSKNFSFNAGGGKGITTDSLYPVFFAGHGYQLVDANSWDNEKGGYKVVGQVKKFGYDFATGKYYGSSPQLMYAMNYLIESRKARVLANPKILMTNGQTSTIDLTADYVSKVTTQYLDNGGLNAQVQREYEVGNDNGIKIEITPFISPDGYVTLDIKPEFKSIADRIYATGATGQSELAATLLQRRDLELKGVRIKDGETLVIGGLIQETESKTVTKIPFLGDIPVLGMFFRSTGTSKDKTEMVMMITPQIVIDTEDAVAEDNVL